MIKMNLGDTELILSVCRKYKLSAPETAYVLATAYHETAHTMKPIKELGGERYLKSKKYYPYFGRGYVQLTWKENYIKAGKKLGADFIHNPGLLLEARYAAPILVVGMIEGWFTGKKLSDYISGTKSDFVSARRIINGIDKASLISDYAKIYLTYLLNEPQKTVEAPKDYVVPVQPPVPNPSVQAPKVGFWAKLLELLKKLFKRT